LIWSSSLDWLNSPETFKKQELQRRWDFFEKDYAWVQKIRLVRGRKVKRTSLFTVSRKKIPEFEKMILIQWGFGGFGDKEVKNSQSLQSAVLSKYYELEPRVSGSVKI